MEILFDRLCAPASLREGWSKVLGNAGAPGGDGVSVHTFAHRSENEIARLAEDLRGGQYRPGPIRRVAIPKRSGGTRPLAIPCVRDRVVQTALHMLLDPLLDPTFSEDSFAYRRGRGVQDAIQRIQALHREGFRHVVDADVRRFFENVPHHRLMQRLQAVVADPNVCRLVGLWLNQEKDGRGLAQGSPISPLLANLYLDHLDDTIGSRGLRLVRFADDFVVLCRSADIADESLSRVTKILGELGLELNIEKTRLVDFDRGFQFLGKLFVKSFVFAGTDEPPLLDLPRESALPQSHILAGDLPPPFESQAPAPVDSASSVEAPGRGQALPLLDWTPDRRIADDLHDLSPILRPVYLVRDRRHLGLRGEAFAVTDGDTLVTTLPPRRVGRLELGPDATVDAAALRHALAWNIPVAFVSYGGRTLGSLEPPPRHGTLHLAQARAAADPQRCLALARSIAEARMKNQRALLSRLNRRRKDERVADAATRIGRIARKLRIALTVDAVRGVEGEAAALYWPHLGRLMLNGFGLQRREREPPATAADLLLSFAAGLLTRDVEALLTRHGLHPGIGFLHAARDHAAPLAWDIIEAFRAPLVEGFVVYSVNNKVITLDHVGQQDGQWTTTPLGRERFVRAYEAWMSRPIRNHRTGTESVWRGLIEDEILALRRAITEGETFDPYVMDY